MYGRLSRGISIRKGLSQTGSAGGTVLNGRITWRPVKASPEAQLRLLELADLDAELGRLEHRRQGLPDHAELDPLEQRDAQLRATVASLEAEQGDLTRAQAKAEADGDQVRAPTDRDRQRLDAGRVSAPREL